MDVFTIRGVDAVLRVGESEFKFVDPRFQDKILLQRQWNEHVKTKSETQDLLSFIEETRELNKKNIKLYIPSVTDEFLESLGDSAFSALMEHIEQLTAQKFGAVVVKVDEKKP